MKNKVLLVGVLFTLLLMSSLYLLVIKNNQSTKSVAVIMANGFSAHEQVYSGIIEAAASSKYANIIKVNPYWVNIFDKIQLTSVCESVLLEEPSVIIVGGGLASQVVYELLGKRKVKTPAIFVGVGNPIELGIINSFEAPGGPMTGVVIASAQGMPGQVFKVLNPNASRVIIPRDSVNDADQLFDEYIMNIKRCLESQGVVVDVVFYDGISEALRTIKPFLSKYDALIGMELGSLMQIANGVSKLCDEAGITFFCCAFDGLLNNAAITYATNTAYLGHEAVVMATEILFEGKWPASMPVRSIAHARDIYINMAAAARQGYVPNMPQIKADLAAGDGLAWLVDRVRIV